MLYSATTRLRRALGAPGDNVQHQALRTLSEDLAHEPLTFAGAVVSVPVWLMCIVTCILGAALFMAVRGAN